MTDRYGNNIMVGDFLIVEAPIEGFLDENKRYEVLSLREEEGRVVVTDDRGLEGWYRSTRFTISVAHRMKKTLDAMD